LDFLAAQKFNKNIITRTNVIWQKKTELPNFSLYSPGGSMFWLVVRPPNLPFPLGSGSPI